MNAEEERSITEITILPDGRIFLFGASRQVLEVLDQLNLGDPVLKQRIEQTKSLEAGGAGGLLFQRSDRRCESRSR